jgi:hypothetical protein
MVVLAREVPRSLEVAAAVHRLSEQTQQQQPEATAALVQHRLFLAVR